MKNKNVAQGISVTPDVWGAGGELSPKAWVGMNRLYDDPCGRDLYGGGSTFSVEGGSRPSGPDVPPTSSPMPSRPSTSPGKVPNAPGGGLGRGTSRDGARPPTGSTGLVGGLGMLCLLLRVKEGDWECCFYFSEVSVVKNSRGQR